MTVAKLEQLANWYIEFECCSKSPGTDSTREGQEQAEEESPTYDPVIEVSDLVDK